MSLPNPEFHVDCVMCDQSFSATADTLEQLVEIVALHLKQVMNENDKPHQGYFKKHDGAENRSAELLRKYPNDPRAILNSPGFKWDILRLVPYYRIHKIDLDPFGGSGTSSTSQKKSAIEPVANPPTQ